MGQDMLLTEEKIRSRLNELYPLRWCDQRIIPSFLTLEETSGQVNPPIPGESLFHSQGTPMALGQTWTGRDRYLWLYAKVTLPAQWKTPVGVFDFGITGSGYNFGFESMLYVDGHPYQSVDTNHQEVFFRQEHTGRPLELVFRLWSGLEGGGIPRQLTHTLQTAFLADLHTPTDDLYYLGDTVLRTVQVLQDDRLERYDLLHSLDKAIRLIDWTDKGTPGFYETVVQADHDLNQAIDAMEKTSRATVSCVGHTHIDTAWRWRLKHTAEKASRSFSTVLRYMEQYPEFIFLHTQPQQYAYIKEFFPEIWQQIKARVAEGRWEIDGAMWVEPDCVLTGGESLTRQLLMGRQFMLEEFGKEPEYLWLPDVFGYSYALPQILKKSGISMFMTTKIAWNQYNRMPNDTFLWKGLDGSEVLAHFITNPEPGQDVQTNYYSNYNGILLPDVMTGSWKLYREKHIHPETLVSYGYGDGGGGVTREMLERRRHMDRLPGLPRVKTSTAGDYFRRLQKSFSETDSPVATWDGEMYLEYHRGTYTSQALMKKLNRRMEELYRKAEWLTVMQAVRAGNLSCAQQQRLNQGWRKLLTHQFHDILPGSSIREVYEDAQVHYQDMADIAGSVIRESVSAMTAAGGGYTVLNELSHAFSGLVLLEGFDPDGKVLLQDGQPVPVQQSQDGTLAYVQNVPAMGSAWLEVQDYTGKTSSPQPWTAVEELGHELRLENAHYRILLNPAGQIATLFDKEQGCEVLAPNQRGNVLQFFEDKPLDYDAWDIDMYYYQKMQEVTDLTRRTLLENGPLRMVLRQEWNISKSHIVQDMILYRYDKRIDFRTQVDWQEQQKLLKAAFPVDIRTTYATYDIQYGNIRRSNNSNSSWDRAKFEVAGHRFADLSEYGSGVSLLNDCKYGYDVHQNVMRLTLLKAGIFPDPQADRGLHTFTYAIYPHTGSFVEGGTVQKAAELNQPLTAFSGKLAMPEIRGSTLRISGVHAQLDACKQSEDGQSLVVRFHEYAGAKGTAHIQFGFPVRQVRQCDLMERPQTGPEPLTHNALQLKVKPYEIISLLVTL